MTAAVDDLAGDLIQELGYAGLVVLMAVEHVFPPIPSELVLPLAGFEVGRGNLNLIGALAASTAGSIIGASLLYLLARRGGRPLVLRLRRLLRLDEHDIDRAERRFRRHDAWIVLLGRMVPGLRSLVSLPPGLLRMPFGRYLALTLTGSLVWNTALIVTGQQLGSRWSAVGGIIGPVAQWVLVTIIPVSLLTLVVRHRRINPAAPNGHAACATSQLDPRRTPARFTASAPQLPDGADLTARANYETKRPKRYGASAGSASTSADAKLVIDGADPAATWSAFAILGPWAPAGPRGTSTVHSPQPC